MDLQEKMCILQQTAQDDISQEVKLTTWETDEVDPSVHPLDTPFKDQIELKIGMTNGCINNCHYCGARTSHEVVGLSPKEIAGIGWDLYRKNKMHRFFLTSGIIRDPDYTMELICETLRILRTEHRYPGYVHAKIMPGSSHEMIKKVAIYADRMSVNLELPSQESLVTIAPEKTKELIFGPMEYVSRNLIRPKGGGFYQEKPLLPAGHTTQMIVGASPETDQQIIRLSQGLYRKFALRRVYYSAFRPVRHSDLLAGVPKESLLRQHRLYQADWLIREYDFQPEELFTPDEPYLRDIMDPKLVWALRHPEFFPVEVNTADYHQLIRVPGIGVAGAKKIQNARRLGRVTFDVLYKIGIRLKRSKFFITCDGRFSSGVDLERTFAEGVGLVNTPDQFAPDQYPHLSVFPLLEFCTTRTQVPGRDCGLGSAWSKRQPFLRTLH